MIRTFFSLLCLVPASLAACAVWAADTLPLAELAKPGRVLMLRHAYAPGTGDPPGFRLDECATQRNLDATGRAQAAALGKRLKQAGITRAQLYSSQWCRCLETARLLELGSVETLPVLNSFYGRPQEGGARIAALRSFLAGLPEEGPPVLLVTHQVTINAFTDAGTPSGGGSVFRLNGSGTPRRLGSIRAD
ncbi:MAG: histidine phosphatase family protein [Burkholderiales bacterium]